MAFGPLVKYTGQHQVLTISYLLQGCQKQTPGVLCCYKSMQLSTQTLIGRAINLNAVTGKLWMPKRVVFTPEALEEPFGQSIYERVKHLDLNIEVLKSKRVTGLRGATEKETYKIAKNTLAIVNAPPSAFRLTPIPPSADFQFHLAEGCPAHCQYCYLAGSLQGPPVIRVFANLPLILQNTSNYMQAGKVTSLKQVAILIR